MGISRVERVEACRTCRLGGESIVSRFRPRRLAGGGILTQSAENRR